MSFSTPLRKVALIAAAAVISAFGQSATQAQRVLGVVTEKQGSGAKVKTDAGEIWSIVFSPETKFQKVAPGETSLKNAQSISAGDLSEGDRVLARGTGTDPKTIVVQSVVVMSKSALAEKQQKEHEEWTRHGINGTVTAVDPEKRLITIRLPAVANQQTVAITVKENAPARRYSQDSVRFADAKPAPLTEVKPGDQLRARGEKSADGAAFQADELVTGTFRTLAATVNTVSPDSSEMQIKDLDTNKVLTVKVTPDSTLKRLPEFGGPGGPGGGGPNRGAPAAGGPGGAGPGAGGPRAFGGGGPGGERRAEGAAGQEGPGRGGPGTMGGGGGGGRMPDLQRMMERLPQAKLADIKPGDTIIVASTAGAADHMTAITVLAGAERIVAMRRAMTARQAGGGAGGNSGAVGVNWNLGEMSMPMP